MEIFTWVEGGFAQAHEHPDVRGRERVYRLRADRLRAVAGGWLARFG